MDSVVKAEGGNLVELDPANREVVGAGGGDTENLWEEVRGAGGGDSA